MCVCVWGGGGGGGGHRLLLQEAKVGEDHCLSLQVVKEGGDCPIFCWCPQSISTSVIGEGLQVRFP